MKYQSSNTKLTHDIEFQEGIKKRYVCPECSSNRKNRKDKCLEYYPDSNRAYCFHCSTTFFEYKPYETEKIYVVPECTNKTDLSDAAVKWFTGRGINQETLLKAKIYTDIEWMPHREKEMGVICFPFFYNGKLINTKFRSGDKGFKLISGAERIMWNLDAVKDQTEIIITEGEIDALTFIQCGFKNCMSVPNGANKNLDYLDNYMYLFNDIERVYLATDNDSRGIELRDELIRRFGPDKCYTINFKECKDANEYNFKHKDDFNNLISDAKPIPVKGVITASDIYDDIRNLFDNGIQKGKLINQDQFDNFVSWELRRLAVGTGVPGSGKSEVVDYILAKLNKLYGWKSVFFTPENFPLKFHYQKLFEKFIGKKFDSSKSTDQDFDDAYEYINENFFYILPEDEDFTIDNILNTALSLIRNRGIKVLVIDPYNRLEHKYTDSETKYISSFLDKLTRFAQINNILIILIAHPRKMAKGDIPSLYDINGSANFYNKCDYGFIVDRPINSDGMMSQEVDVYWKKIKFKHLGKQGISKLIYNYNNGRYEDDTGDVNSWDNKNWLSTQAEYNPDLTIEPDNDYFAKIDVPF